MRKRLFSPRKKTIFERIFNLIGLQKHSITGPGVGWYEERGDQMSGWNRIRGGLYV